MIAPMKRCPSTPARAYMLMIHTAKLHAEF